MNAPKKKALNRALLRFSQALLIGSCLALLLSSFLFPGTILVRVIAAVQIAAILLWFFTHRCPYCHAFHAALQASGEDAGVCRKCGRDMEFKD